MIDTDKIIAVILGEASLAAVWLMDWIDIKHSFQLFIYGVISAVGGLFGKWLFKYLKEIVEKRQLKNRKIKAKRREEVQRDKIV